MLALGLMSGTSMDGIDAALVQTDGVIIERFGASVMMPYPPSVLSRLRQAIKGDAVDLPVLEEAITRAHAEAVRILIGQAGLETWDVDVVGFHGQTIRHRPAERLTQQLGNGALLAELTGVNVICDFRRRDMAAGGQGAPLVPLFHAALVRDLPGPVAVVNIGGVANITWVDGEDIVACDTGPGNALLDDWMKRHTERVRDEGGELALSGAVQFMVLDELLNDPFFALPPPKSLDRNHFHMRIRESRLLEGLSLADGAATLAAFTGAAIGKALDHMPSPPLQVIVCGGGRHNQAIMRAAAKYAQETAGLYQASTDVRACEALAWNGDMLEAQAFAYLAVRSLHGLPLTLPSTTGVIRAVTGGAFYRA